jgi:acetoin utilization deacetylase AcuC-like enzyme
MKAFYCDHFVLPLPATHRFPMAKYRLLRERVLEERIVAADDLRVPEAASWETLCLVHARAYVAAVAEGRLAAEAQRRIGFPWSPQMVERSRRSVGATIAAARSALAEGTAANLAGGTHHAFSDRGEGFCVFNDVAVAARALQCDGCARRPAVVDCDVHQGNGTAAIFRADDSVFTFSIHGEKNFPFRKEQSDLDVMLADGTDDGTYLEELDAALGIVFDRHAPDLIFYIAGADPYERDRLGRLAVSIGGLAARDALVFDRCRRAGVPVAVVMGGGYAADVHAIVQIHANTIREAARCANDPVAIGSSVIGSQSSVAGSARTEN